MAIKHCFNVLTESLFVKASTIYKELPGFMLGSQTQYVKSVLNHLFRVPAGLLSQC